MVKHEGSRGFRPDIEGLRGIAILLVVAYHAGVTPFHGGYIGVDVFFVLSGYLITGILARELVQTRALDFGRFYARRARRLLPAVFVLLGATAAGGYLLYAPVTQRELTKSALAAASYVSNLYFAHAATNYLNPGSHDNPLLHMWSLGVEEQFYLFWPIFLLVVARLISVRTKVVAAVRLMPAIAIIGFASLALSIWLTAWRQPWAFFLPFTRGWEFAIGGLAALSPSLLDRGEAGYVGARLGPIKEIAGWLGLLAILLASTVYSSATEFPGLAATLPAIGTAILLRIGAGRSLTRVSRWLGNQGLREFGRVSYSWYLWHWPVLVFTASLSGRSALAIRLAAVAISFLLAELSYRLVENPLRYSSWLKASSARSLGFAAVLTIASVSVGGAWYAAASRAERLPSQAMFTRARADFPIVNQQGCMTSYYSVEVKPCTFAHKAASTVAVLFGDSHAAQWVPAVASLGNSQGWKVVTLTKSACPAATVTRIEPALKRPYVECDRWRARAIKQLRAEHPDIIFMSSSEAYGIPPAQWRHGLEVTLQKLQSTGAVIFYIEDTPEPGFDVLKCLSRVAWRSSWQTGRGCSFERKSALPALGDIDARVASEFPNVHAISMTTAVCPSTRCTGERGDLVIYRDYGHLTASFARTLEPALLQRVRNPLAGRGLLRPKFDSSS